MAEMKVELKGEDINRAVADAIVKSVLGDAIVKGVNDYVQTMVRNSYNNPIKDVIERITKDEIHKLVLLQLPVIQEEVRKQMAQDAVGKIVTNVLDKLMRTL